jgi:hypothetical protein
MLPNFFYTSSVERERERERERMDVFGFDLGL